MKKALIKTLSSLSLTAVAIAPLLASCSKKDSKTEYHIMSISDIRGEIPGYGDPDFKDLESKYAGAIRITDAMQEIAEKSKDFVILSGGDQTGSGKFSSCTQGETMYEVMKAMGIRYSAVGNHEWDWGFDKLADTANGYDHMGRTDKTEGNYFITANVSENPSRTDYEWTIDESNEQFAKDFAIWNNERVTWADPYKVLDLGGHKVCLIGLTTQDTLFDGNQMYIKDNYSFINYNASIHYSKYLLKTTDLETYNQIESYILLTHCGASEQGWWIGGDAGEIANKIDTPIDAVLAAHTRTPVCGYVWNNILDRKIAIAQVDDKMRSFIDLQIEFDDSKSVGQRFKNITPKVIYPNIEKSSFEAATAQLQAIKDNPRNDVVKNVCEVYDAQKQIVLNKLKKEIGKTTTGLKYLQADYLQKYKYPEDLDETLEGVLVEQAGAFTCKSLIEGYNLYYKEQRFEESQRRKANIGYVSNVSINRGINVETLEDGKITLSSLYDLFPYDECTVTSCLTYYQLEQVVRYMLTGKKDHTDQDVCTDEFFCVKDSRTPIIYPNLKFPFGPNQFYGFAFQTENASSTDKQFRKYDYKADSLVVYDPTNSDCRIDDPTTWKGKDYWQEQEEEKQYITIVMNNFDFDYGNQQNRMIQDFALFNQNEHPEPIHIHTDVSLDVRDLCQKYIEYLTSQSIEVTMDDETCWKLTHIQEER